MSRWSPKGVALLRECSGDHGAHTDNCMGCAPWWRLYPVCPKCERKAGMTKRKGIVCCVNETCEAKGDRFHHPKEE